MNNYICIGGPYAGKRVASYGRALVVAETVKTEVRYQGGGDELADIEHKVFHYEPMNIMGVVCWVPVNWPSEKIIAELLNSYRREKDGIERNVGSSGRRTSDGVGSTGA